MPISWQKGSGGTSEGITAAKHHGNGRMRALRTAVQMDEGSAGIAESTQKQSQWSEDGRCQGLAVFQGGGKRLKMKSEESKERC